MTAMGRPEAVLSADEVIAAYAAGKTIEQVASEFRTHKSRIAGLLQERRIANRWTGGPKLPPDRCPRMLQPWPVVPYYDDAEPGPADAAPLGRRIPVSGDERISYLGNAMMALPRAPFAGVE